MFKPVLIVEETSEEGKMLKIEAGELWKTHKGDHEVQASSYKMNKS